MDTIRKRLAALASQCDNDERELIEQMIGNAADYVQTVVKMETIADNVAGRSDTELRSAVSEADHTRTIIHNSLISRVDIVNRICAAHNLPPIYTGDSQRRHYGDFALELVKEIFENRR